MTHGSRLRAAAAFRLVGRTSRDFRRTALLLLLLLVAVATWGWRESQNMRREIESLREQMQRAQADNRHLAARVEGERRRALAAQREVESTLASLIAREEELQDRIAEAASGEVLILREELAGTRSRIQQLESERAAGETVIRRFGRGVCLIQGAYAFEAAAATPASGGAEKDGHPASADAPREGDGPGKQVDYYGTGFLVDRRGLVLTNRHLAEPWWRDKNADELAKAGLRPRLLRLRAFFPGQSQPFALTPVRVAETVDLALLSAEGLPRRGIPVLPLDSGKGGAVPGQPVVVVGYPAGLEAILAKVETSMVTTLLASPGLDASQVTEALSRKGLIRPSTTQGHIGDVTSSDIVFDAASSEGGSGGPVFNKRGQVIAIAYAVLTRFGGNSFGIPISYARELLRGAGTRSGD